MSESYNVNEENKPAFPKWIFIMVGLMIVSTSLFLLSFNLFADYFAEQNAKVISEKILNS